MAEPITIARPYAKAIFDVALEQNNLDKWSELLKILSRIVVDPQISEVIHDPRNEKAQIKSLITGLFPEALHEDVARLSDVFQEYDRLSVVPEVARQYELLKTEEQNALDAVVESAYSLSQKENDKLVSLLSKKYGKKIYLHVLEKPELIGGVRIMIGDEVIDGSVRGKLQVMAARLEN